MAPGDSDASHDVAAFLARHPWPAEMARGRRTFDWTMRFDLEAPPEAVWAFVADHSRFSRAFGMGRMELEERDGLVHGTARYGGLRHDWIEAPWQWVAGREFVCLRSYVRGPPIVMRHIDLLEPLDGGRRTRLHVYYGFLARGALARFGLPIWWLGTRRGYRRAIAQLGEALARPTVAAFAVPPAPLPDGGRVRLAEVRAELDRRGVRGPEVDRLIDHAATADDLDAYRIQIRRLARRWELDERRLIEAALHAARAGLLELSWDVMCPHCRGVRREAATLAEVDERGRCDVCEIDFSTGAENAVEVTFHVHPAVRRVDKVLYCSAEPSTKAHIQLQQHLGPGARRELATRVPPGRYRLRTRPATPGALGEAAGIAPSGGRSSRRVDSAGAPASWRAADAVQRQVTIDVGAGGVHRLDLDLGGELAPARLAPSPTFALSNPTADPISVVLEEIGWADDALRPAQLFSLQAFRDLFGEAYLQAAVQLAVGEQTILFTDIVGSTRFYTEVGDPAAFVAVKRHFAAVFGAVRDAGGAVVKTIGDAVMAAFVDPVEAFAAALEIQRRMSGADDAPAPVRLRVSLNRGSCIAVNLNSGIDYFGSAVNTAAKLQRCADAGEIAIGGSVWRAAGVAERAAALGLASRATTLRHDALGDLEVVVVAVAPAATAPLPR